MELQTGKTLDALELRETHRRLPVDDHGKLRMNYFSVPALASALADGSTIGLAWLPPGRKRILPNLSRISTSAFGAGRTLDIGHGAYLDRPAGLSTSDADEDDDAFVAALDVSGAVAATAFGTGIKFDMYSMAEVLLFATINGGTMPTGATLEGYIAYLYE